MPPSGGQRTPYVAAALTFLAAASKVSFRRSQAFVPSVRHHVPEGARPSPVVQRQPTASASTSTSAWVLSLPAVAVAAAGARRRARTNKPSLGLSPAPVQESLVAMAGGRRNRLGVRGKVCMLTGTRKQVQIRRSYSEKINRSYQRPNIRWKKLWWEREQKWVKLQVCTKAIKKVDHVGLEAMAHRAGLDLYAWSRNHWEKGSTQPLPLRVGYTRKAKRMLHKWRHYLPKLNQGAALADVFYAKQRPEKSMRNLRPQAMDKSMKKVTPLARPPKKFPERMLSNKILNIRQL